VHFTTVYRWEKAKGPVLDPLHAAVIVGLRRLPRAMLGPLGKLVQRSLLAGGTLSALRVILEAVAAPS
jgi:hypothetical protein